MHDIEEPTNFGPINLLPIRSKILENVISIQLNKGVFRKKIIKRKSICHQNNSCTERALLNIAEQIYKSMDESRVSLLFSPKPLTV